MLKGTWTRHADQIRVRQENVTGCPPFFHPDPAAATSVEREAPNRGGEKDVTEETDELDDPPVLVPQETVPVVQIELCPTLSPQDRCSVVSDDSVQSSDSVEKPTTPRRSTRIRNKPNRFLLVNRLLY